MPLARMMNWTHPESLSNTEGIKAVMEFLDIHHTEHVEESTLRLLDIPTNLTELLDVNVTVDAEEGTPADGSGLIWDASEAEYIEADISGTDEKLKVDATATPGYLGAAYNDGILRVDQNELTYADGGDYATLGLANHNTARIALGLAIGTDVQAYDAGLANLAGISMQADRFYYTSGDNTHVAGTITATGRNLIDDANTGAQRTTLGVGTGDSPEFVTAKLTGLTDGYMPYHVADATGLANSPIFIDGAAVYINETSNVNMAEGLTIGVSAGTSGHQITLKRGDLNHSYASVENDTFFYMKASAAEYGGVMMGAIGSNIWGYDFWAITGADTFVKTVDAQAPFYFEASLIDDITLTAHAANANIFVIKNHGAALFLVDADGDAKIFGDLDVVGTTNIKLDDLATPDDNTDLNFSTSRHGLVPKGLDAGDFLKDDGTWTTLPGGGDVVAGATLINNRLVRGDTPDKGIQTSGITIDDSNNVSGIADITTSGVHKLNSYFYLSSLYSATDNVWGYNLIRHPTDASKLKNLSGAGSIDPQAIIMGQANGITFITTGSNPGADADVVIATAKTMKLDSSGNLWLYSATSKLTGGTKLSIEAGATGIYSLTIRDDTTVTGATCQIGASSGQFKRDTSSMKYKDKIEDLEADSSLIYNLRPASFNSLCKDDDKEIRFIGLIAEEVEQVYPEMIHYGENNETEGYDSKMLMTLILDQVQGINKRVNKLEEKTI